jgi:hypothetical protein
MSKLYDNKQAGTFEIQERHVYGELTVKNRDTSLYVRDENYFDIYAIKKNNCIQGTLHDLTKVSLFGCIPSSSGRTNRGAGGYESATLFAHFVISGERHLKPTDETITSIRFAIDDSPTLFYDFDAFGNVINAEKYIEVIANANKQIHHRDVAVGPEPQIIYFSGKREIFSAATVIGTGSSSHNPHPTWPGPSGIAIKNLIVNEIKFNVPVNFDAAFSNVLALVRYYELLVGRQQNLLDLAITIGDGQDYTQHLNVDWSMAPKREDRNKERSPHPGDVLVNAVDDPKKFGDILGKWLTKEEQWRAGRLRFSGSFNTRHHYDVDRLVAVANMFDILPSAASSPSVSLSPEVERAKIQAREIFHNLPNSGDRDSILNALGRLGKPNLKSKIGGRAKIITDCVETRFPELKFVTDKAVNCRNYFVHSGKQDFDYGKNWSVISFFVDTLEFVFGASELVEAGWNITEWCKQSTVMSHPFCEYKIEYNTRLQRLHHLLDASKV